MANVYIDAPIVMPGRSYIMMDKNLDTTRRNYITSNRINFNNALRARNMLPQVKTWDRNI